MKAIHLKISLLIILMAVLTTPLLASFPNPKDTIPNTPTKEVKVKEQTVVVKKSIFNMERFPSEGKNKSQALALILALIVGVIGIHRFYLGYTAIGILQIYTSGLCLIWTLYDIIQIATGNLKPRYGEYHEELDKQKKSPN